MERRATTPANILPVPLVVAVLALMLSGQTFSRTWHVKHLYGLTGGWPGDGALTEQKSTLTYSEDKKKSQGFTLSCADFLNASGQAAGHEVKIRTAGKKYWLTPVGDYNIHQYNLYQQVTAACVEEELRSGTLKATSASYDALSVGREASAHDRELGLSYSQPGKLDVMDSGVRYSRPDGTPVFSTSCAEFLAQAEVFGADAGKDSGLYYADQFVRPKRLSAEAVYRGIAEVCGVNEPERVAKVAAETAEEAAESARRAKAEADEAENLRASLQAKEAALQAESQAKEAALAAEFQNRVRTLWRATEETDAFASVRGDFDLASPTPAWKTKLLLPYADQCVLLKNAVAPQTQKVVRGKDGQPIRHSEGVWTFACRFSPGGSNEHVTYENIVERVQSALGLKFEPDAMATNVNQVLFADTLKPAWKLVVTKVNPSLVVLWITAAQLEMQLRSARPHILRRPRFARKLKRSGMANILRCLRPRARHRMVLPAGPR